MKHENKKLPPNKILINVGMGPNSFFNISFIADIFV